MAGAVATFGVISATSHLVGLSVSQARAPPSAGHNLPCCGPHPWIVHIPTHFSEGVAWGSIHGNLWGRSDSLSWQRSTSSKQTFSPIASRCGATRPPRSLVVPWCSLMTAARKCCWPMIRSNRYSYGYSLWNLSNTNSQRVSYTNSLFNSLYLTISWQEEWRPFASTGRPDPSLDCPHILQHQAAEHKAKK